MKQTVFRVELGTHSHLPPARAERRLPPGPPLVFDEDGWDLARLAFWTAIKTIAFSAAILLAYAVAIS